ncbi:L,D-transpeptidase family protein [Pleionea sp. CnH1-48]|uniref:L,D-transpeptidase family protein n=1 Tax=Pleionea sp. CnH1-48 TaxID=2954494 RepID=UPI002096E4BB|nr:murein L,D-transpeptidase [Pleionea sp. CnH1-48]
MTNNEITEEQQYKPPIANRKDGLPESDRSNQAIAKNKPALEALLAQKKLSLGASVFIRVFKEESLLEAWVANTGGSFELFKTYEICTFSGDLGPKLKEGDRQSPEGFYFVKPNQLNPWSRFHLSFNLGYPNAYDRYHKRTGSALMIHGNCVSIGCYAMTDPYIEEIYTLVNAALANGQGFFRVHAFPFRMTEERLNREKNHQWYSFWKNLKEGYDWFEEKGTPPNVTVSNGRYMFGES